MNDAINKELAQTSVLPNEVGGTPVVETTAEEVKVRFVQSEEDFGGEVTEPTAQ